MDINLIYSIIHTLDTVQVSGRNNLDKLLGCINALETIAQHLKGDDTDGG